MDSNPDSSHLTPAARRRIDILMEDVESRVIESTAAFNISGKDSPRYREARALSSAARTALREALDALTWPEAYRTQAIDLDRL